MIFLLWEWGGESISSMTWVGSIHFVRYHRSVSRKLLRNIKGEFRMLVMNIIVRYWTSIVEWSGNVTDGVYMSFC